MSQKLFSPAFLKMFIWSRTVLLDLFFHPFSVIFHVLLCFSHKNEQTECG